MEKKWNIVVVVLILTAIVGGSIILCFPGNYITPESDFNTLFHKYYKVADIGYKADLVERKGIFEAGIEGSELVLAEDDVEFVFNANTMERIYVVIKGNRITFGDKKVSVGDSRGKIEKVFRHSRRPKPAYGTFAYFDEQGNTVIVEADEYCDDDGLLSVGFEYDGMDKVKNIFVGYGPNN